MLPGFLSPQVNFEVTLIIIYVARSQSVWTVLQTEYISNHHPSGVVRKAADIRVVLL